MTYDAIALLQSNDTKPTYHTAIIYTKLMPWLQSNYPKFGTHGIAEQGQLIRERYSKDRDVQLILLVRHEDGKCPINPLPIKGEFHTGEMSKLLKSMGRTYKEKVHGGMFA